MSDSNPKKLFVGNLSWDAKDDDLRKLFSECGEIEEAVVITERGTGRSKGFGFVTFAKAEDAEAAIEKFNEFEFLGRALTVNEAQPPKPRENRFSGPRRF
jgi:RNA recognition motif-containing protein